MTSRTTILPKRNLSGFTGSGYQKGRPFIVQGLWFAALHLAFYRWWFPPAWRPPLLRLFGAKIGNHVLIRHRVRVLWPWKLSIGNDSWIGEDVFLLNLESISIGSDVCISQGAWIITGSHDRTSSTFEFDNRPITIKDGAWIAARATVLRGVTVGAMSTVGAGVVLRHDIGSNCIKAGSDRWSSERMPSTP